LTLTFDQTKNDYQGGNSREEDSPGRMLGEVI